MTDCESVNASKVYIDMKENIRHVTIRQIKGAEQMHKTAPLLIDGAEASSLIVVANICDCREDRSDSWFSLDDGTGRLRCLIRDWTPESALSHFAYVRAILKQRGTKKSFEVTHLDLLTDSYQIFHHSLMVIEDALKYAGNKKDGQSANPGSETTLPHAHLDVSVSDASDVTIHDDHRRAPPVKHYGELSVRRVEQDDWPPPATGLSRTVSAATTDSYHTACSTNPSPESSLGCRQGLASHHSQYEMPNRNLYVLTPANRISHYYGIRDPYDHLTKTQRDIILCINHASEAMEQHASPEELQDGVNITVISQAMLQKYGARLQESDFAKDIEYLVDEGHIFTTVDDMHYNVTERFQMI